jgi:MFS family permease
MELPPDRLGDLSFTYLVYFSSFFTVLSGTKVPFKTEMATEASFLAHLRLVVSQSHITPQVLEHQYSGSGTEEDPYIVEFLHNDPRNPRNFPTLGKWTITILVAIATFGVTFDSSAYTGGIRQIIEQFGVNQEVATLGVSLFVLGFAIGPLLWAPLSELYGRQIVFIATYGALSILCAGAAGSQNIQTLISLRAFAGAFGSSPLTNAGGVIADLFPAEQRGLATAFFAAAPFLGPTLGPIVGGFVGEAEGWRWIMGLMAIFTGALWILCTLMVPETYPPVLLSMRAKKLSKITGRIYKSRLEFDMKKRTTSQVFQTSLARPWALLLREPIVLLLSTYMAISLCLSILEHVLAGFF